MNKNLKKVISAVAALAMSASTFVAFAANYPDVDASASYKQAVDELSALNVINGYDDGTFQPDKLVSRAEFAKMVVISSGKAMVAQAEAAANTNTKFNDVKGDHWAAGYVTAATANKIINGMDDKTFAPDANITYAQAMKMLVCAAGYEQWSADKGGWPTGYMYWGNQLDLGNGVKDVVQDTEITRAQCAQMIDNALNAPVCVETGRTSFDRFGNPYAELEPKDDYGKDFQSILTKQHKAYKVKGMVTGTHKSGDSKSDEVSFKITSARNWNNEEDQISRKNENQETITALIGESEADKFLHKYVEALIAVDDDDEYTILSLSETGKNEVVTVAAADYDEDYKDDSFVETKMYILKNGKSSNYKIAKGAEMFVNGVSIGEYTNENVAKYVIGNNVGNITLINTPEDTSTPNEYDYIMVEHFLTATVDSVNVVDDENIEISFLESDDEVSSELNPWVIDLADEDVVYSFVSDGESYDIASLDQFDVLSIQANPEELSKSSFYDVQVSKASTAVQGQVKSYDPEDKEYTINGTVYKTTAKVEDSLVAGDSYTLYLDVFGRIAYTDELASDKKIAILDSAYLEASGDSKAKLILPDGTTADYTLKDKTENVKAALEAVWNNKTDSSDGKKPVQDRVVEYSVTNNELTIKKVLTARGGDELEYRANQDRLGKYIINSEATSFIYAGSNKSTDITAMNMNTLVDGNFYEAYFYDMSTSNSVYRFVIVKTGAGQLTADSSMAIVKKYVAMTDEKRGETVDALVLLIDGEEQTVMADDGVDLSGYAEGDAILYGTNAEGYVKEVISLATGVDLTAGYADIFEAAMVKDADLVNVADVEKLPATKKGEATLVFGPIVDKTTNSITIGALEDGDEGLVSDKTEGTISYASKVNFYTYNYNQPAKSRVAAANSGAVSGISIPTEAYVDKAEKAAFYWNGLSDSTNPRFALVKVVDEEATDIYVIIPKTGTKIDKSSL